jgi:hypothetical protein
MNPYLQAAAFNLSFESQVFFNRFEQTITASQFEARFLIERDRRLAYLKRPLRGIEQSIKALKSYSVAGEFAADVESLRHSFASLPDRIVTLFLPEKLEGSEWQELTAYRESIEFFMDASRHYGIFSDGNATDDNAGIEQESDDSPEFRKELELLNSKFRNAAYAKLQEYPTALECLEQSLPDGLRPFFLFGKRLAELPGRITRKHLEERPTDIDLFRFVRNSLQPELDRLHDECRRLLPQIGEQFLIDDESLESSLIEYGEAIQRRLIVPRSIADDWYRGLPNGVSIYGKDIILKAQQRAIILALCRASTPLKYSDFFEAWPAWRDGEHEGRLRTCLSNLRTIIRTQFDLDKTVDPIPDEGTGKKGEWPLNKRAVVTATLRHLSHSSASQ